MSALCSVFCDSQEAGTMSVFLGEVKEKSNLGILFLSGWRKETVNFLTIGVFVLFNFPISLKLT